MNHDIRLEIRDWIGKYPSLFYPTYGMKSKNRLLSICRETKLVIEGYPRSANTFAVVAFNQANPGLHVAHHLHVPAQIIRGARWKIPTLVLIRKPMDAVASCILRTPGLTVDRALKSYCIFYQTIKPLRDSFVIARFEDVVVDFTSIIRKVNARFGTDFNPFTHGKTEEGKVFKEIELLEANALKSPLPNQVKEDLKPELLGQIRNHNSAQLESAEEGYRKFLGEG